MDSRTEFSGTEIGNVTFYMYIKYILYICFLKIVSIQLYVCTMYINRRKFFEYGLKTLHLRRIDEALITQVL